MKLEIDRDASLRNFEITSTNGEDLYFCDTGKSAFNPLEAQSKLIQIVKANDMGDEVIRLNLSDKILRHLCTLRGWLS